SHVNQLRMSWGFQSSGTTRRRSLGPRLNELVGLVGVEPRIAQRGVVTPEFVLVLHGSSDAFCHVVRRDLYVESGGVLSVLLEDVAESQRLGDHVGEMARF